MSDCATDYTRAFILSALPPQAKRVLEVGCGDGRLAAALARDGLEVVAIDLDAALVDAAQRRGVDARQAEWPDFADGAFDAILFTRSLHHVHDLGTSVASAFDALRSNGRVIVEDFMAEGCSQRSETWFASLAALLDRAELLTEPSGHLAEVLGRVPADSGDHHLHSSVAIEAALRAHAASVHVETSACYFRYLLPAVEEERPALAKALLDHESALIEGGAIDALGRRYVAIAPG